MTTVTLKHAVEHGNKTYSSLTFRRARFGDFCAADRVEGEHSKTAAVLAGMASVPLQVIQGIDMEDMSAVLEVAGPLMGNAPTATPGQSPE